MDWEKNSAIIRFYATIVILGINSVSNLYAQKGDLFNAAIRTVVIDAGHGGKDPGCHGAMSNEKDVCLSMALKLGESIRSNFPAIKVVYTRSTDVFVELDDRAKIANKNNADLFICIHANAAGPAAYGCETYVLGLHRTESQKNIAERENATIYLEDDKGEKYKDFDLSPDALIARQLQLAVFLDQSISFAGKLQAEFKSLGRYDRGVKQAGFLVLYKTTMPSVLIETGFLTNPTEEKFLASKEHQQKMADAMFNAFKKYKSELEGINVSNNETFINKVEEKKEKEKVSVRSNSSTSEQVVFRVQIETSSTRVPSTSPQFKGMQIYEYEHGGVYKYTVGSFENNFEAANELKNEMRNSGFQHAFVVAFIENERISLEKAIKLAEK